MQRTCLRFGTMVDFFIWHYGEGLAATYRNALDAVGGCFKFFSVPDLFRTLFTPWHRMAESYGRGFLIQKALSTLVINLFSRVVGATIRLVVIVVGIAASAIAFGASVLAVLLWILLPFLIPLLAASGVALLFF